jgi:hypothetical protein
MTDELMPKLDFQFPEFQFVPPEMIRVRRKLVKLWHFRHEAVLAHMYKELHQCKCVLFGGSAAGSVSKYLGTFGSIYWERDGRGTKEEWLAHRTGLRNYSIGRIAMLETRIKRVEAMKPPEVPEFPRAPGCPRCTRGFIRCEDPECAICASDNDPDCPNATPCPNCNQTLDTQSSDC